MKEYKIGSWTSNDEGYTWIMQSSDPYTSVSKITYYGNWVTDIHEEQLTSQDIADMLHIHQNTPEQLKSIYG